MNINNKLVTFAQQELVIARSEPERLKIVASLEHLETKLRNRFGQDIKELIRFGSFTRNTILPRAYDPLSDGDLMVVFNTSHVKLTPGTYRRKLYDFILAAYPTSISKKDFPVVKLELNHIMFDIIPAYSELDIWGNFNYHIPDKGDGWLVTVPNDINSRLTAKNQSVGDNKVRNVLRLCKHWNASAGYAFESYGMEKWIINRPFKPESNLYENFLVMLNDMAGNRPGVRQALDYIQYYKGVKDEAKEFKWLQKLLPGLS